MNENIHTAYWIQSIRKAHPDSAPVYFPGKNITTKVVGVTFNGRQAVVNSLHVDDPVRLVREPYNPYDPNAIRVETQDGRQIGYIRRFLAAFLAPFFDSYGKPVSGTVVKLYGFGLRAYNLGVDIRFTIPEPVLADDRGEDHDTPEIDF